ncbi:hypothetical protein HYV83_04635 [Candidatus Woesearchaeota archaeon]|nr:hypothetical protein [Candidatus Woesearchaeota archaeon]
MPFIERVAKDLAINWIEDQPSIRPVKNYFVDRGVVASLVDILKKDGSKPARKTVDLDGVFDRVHVKGQYVCEVSRPPDYASNDAIPVFLVRIGFSDRRQPWDAIGDVYTSPFPDWLSQSL